MTSSRFDSAFNDYVMPASERAFGVTVTLTRGILVTDSFTARRDDLSYLSFGFDENSSGKLTTRQYFLPVASCVLSATEVQPRAGDIITDGSETWQIFVPQENAPASEQTAGGYDWVVYARRTS